MRKTAIEVAAGITYLGGYAWFIQEVRNNHAEEWSWYVPLALLAWPILFFSVPFIILAASIRKGFRKVKSLAR